MPPQRTSTSRPAGSKSNRSTQYYSSPDRVYQHSLNYTPQPSPTATWSSKPGANPAAIAPYCSPTSPLPFSIYNFVPPASNAPVPSPAFDRGTSDRGSLPTSATETANDTAFVFPQSTHGNEGQPLPKPMRPPPQPQPEPQPQPHPQPKQSTSAQGQDLYHCPDCSLPDVVPSQDTDASKHQHHQQVKQQPPPVHQAAPDSDWIQASSPDSASDSESTCACSIACDCFDDAVDVAAPGAPAQKDGDVDAEHSCCCSDTASSSGDWVDVAPARQQEKAEQDRDRQAPSPCGPTSLSGGSPQPPPPPPPSPRRRRGEGCPGPGDGPSEDAEMPHRPESSWAGGCC